MPGKASRVIACFVCHNHARTAFSVLFWKCGLPSGPISQERKFRRCILGRPIEKHPRLPESKVTLFTRFLVEISDLFFIWKAQQNVCMLFCWKKVYIYFWIQFFFLRHLPFWWSLADPLCRCGGHFWFGWDISITYFRCHCDVSTRYWIQDHHMIAYIETLFCTNSLSYDI